MQHYNLSQTAIMGENGQKIATYGVKFGDMCIDDVSFDKEKMAILVETMNTEDLHEEHVMDVLYDFLLS
ncbi:MAG: hypothetical protein RR009_09250 [Oscillospiraceae bacterium]